LSNNQNFLKKNNLKFINEWSLFVLFVTMRSCDRTKSHYNNVNAMGFRVSFFCLIVVNGRQLFARLQQKLFYYCCKECMGRRLCLFVCYGEQELRWAMDGERSDCIEEGLQNGWWEVRIKGSVKEKGGRFFLVCKFSCCCSFQTIRLVVDELCCANDLAE